MWRDMSSQLKLVNKFGNLNSIKLKYNVESRVIVLRTLDNHLYKLQQSWYFNPTYYNCPLRSGIWDP